MVACATIYGMEYSTSAAARELGVSQRQVQRLASAGRVASRDVAGRIVVGGGSLVALTRMAGRGRPWSDGMASAAADLLEHGETSRVHGRDLSRLFARLRRADVSALAYQVLGGRVTVWRRSGAATNVDSSDGLSASGLGLDVVVVSRASDHARRARLLQDSDGETLLVELETDGRQSVTDLARFAYGDVRTSSAARELLEHRLLRFR